MSPIANPALIPPVGLDPARAGQNVAAGGASRGVGGSGQNAAAGARGIGDPGRSTGPAGANAASGVSFADVLKDATGAQPLHFSRHALERAQRRGIDLSPATMDRLKEGVGRAAGKGSRGSVVLVDGTAFVVSVANRTVITAVGSQQMKDHVFTNVDSAVIA